jgi:hypothetical protein
MRLFMALTLIVVLGGSILAYFLMDNRQIDASVPLSGCAQCHEVRPYSSPTALHRRHDRLDCRTCHSDAASLRTLPALRGGLRPVMLAGVAVVAAGVVINFILVSRRS